MIPLLITALGLVIRLFRLDSLPGEMWGDIFVHYHLVEQLREGTWVTGFMFGDGPLFSYIAFLVTSIFGLSFYSLKLTSVFINGVYIWLSYFFALKLSGKRRVAGITALLAAVSFWSVSISRTGWPNNLVPIFVEGVILALWQKRYTVAGIVAGMGLYSQAAAWGLVFFALYHWKTAIVIGGIAAGLFIFNPSLLGANNYMGEKFLGQSVGLVEATEKIALNLGKNLLAYFWRGDQGFRHTIPHKAHLDWISGIFLLIGFGYLWKRSVKDNEYQWVKWVILPFLFLQIPSLLDIQHPTSTPNMSRMMGTLPLVFFGIAVGIDQVVERIRSRRGQKVALLLIMGTIASLNLYDYFWRYPLSLPNQNGAYGKRIALVVEEASEEPVPVVQVDCCWADWFEPEYEAVKLQLKDPRRLIPVEKEYFAEWVKDPEAAPNRFLLILSPDNLEAQRMVNENLRVVDRQGVYDGEKQVGLVWLVERWD